MIFGATRVAPEKAVFRPALSLSVQPGFTGEHAMAMSYKEQLLHPNWQRRRLEALNAAGFEWARHGEIAAYLNNVRREDAFELRDAICTIDPDTLLDLVRAEVARQMLPDAGNGGPGG